MRVALERVPAQDLERLVPDEFAFAIVVGRDDDLGGTLGGAAQRQQRGGGAATDHPGEIGIVDHLAEVLETPPSIRLGEHRLHHVTAEPDGDGFVVAMLEVVGVHLLAATPVLLDRDRPAQDLCDLAGCGVLLGDDQSQASTSTDVAGGAASPGDRSCGPAVMIDALPRQASASPAAARVAWMAKT